MCSLCAEGTYNTGTGIAVSTCSLCSTGTYSSSSGITVSACTNCAAGTYNSATGVSTCSLCVAGTYNTGTGTSTCSFCAAGTYNTGSAIAVSTCSPCDTGTYSTGSGMGTASTCSTCPIGAYNSAGQASACTLCAAGTYNTDTGVSVCSNCTIGTYSTGTGISTPTTCLTCPNGIYPGASSCGFCTAGTHILDLGTGIPTCPPCYPGTYSSSANSATCSQCETGTYSSSSQSSSCLGCKTCTAYGETSVGSCPPGSANDTVVCACVADLYRDTKANTCNRCPANTFSLPSSVSLLDCRCVAGYVCKYTKRIHAVIVLTTAFLETFNSADQQAFLASVAKAASVPSGNVKILEIVSHGGRRLLAATGNKSITVKLAIMGSTSVDDSQLLKSHKNINHVTWEHSHHVEATPQTNSIFNIFNDWY